MISNMEVIQMGTDTVKWCDEKMNEAIQGGRQQEAAAYARLKDMWEERSNAESKKPNNG